MFVYISLLLLYNTVGIHRITIILSVLYVTESKKFKRRSHKTGKHSVATSLLSKMMCFVAIVAYLHL